VNGIYETLFSKLGGDATLQSLLGGTSGDKKIYPITATVRTALPAVKISVEGGETEVGFSINKPSVEVMVVSTAGATELGQISNRIDTLLNIQSFAGSGIKVHLVKKVAERDEYDEATLEYRRRLRYNMIVR
jgi:hypothetical protein